jgi:hypothetical protein
VSSSRLTRAGIGIVVLAFAGLLVWWLSLPSQLGDPAKRFLHVANQTDQSLTVLQLEGGDRRAEITEVPPNSTIETYLPCGAAELIAVNHDGVVVARRPPSDECNLKTWVIQTVDS